VGAGCGLNDGSSLRKKYSAYGTTALVSSRQSASSRGLWVGPSRLGDDQKDHETDADRQLGDAARLCPDGHREQEQSGHGESPDR
jgi:hypothetical protein